MGVCVNQAPCLVLPPSSGLSDLKNPFMSSCVEDIHFFIHKSLYGKKVVMSATVRFKNGSTSGEQEIKSDQFPDLVQCVEEFIKSLPKA